MRTRIILMISMLAASLSFPAFADDDRQPSPEERRAIEHVLRAEGFVSWDDIELDDGNWEVDDARTPDGWECDLELDWRTLRIIERDCDDD